VAIAIFLVQGNLNSWRIPSGICYLVEFVPERYGSIYTTFWFCADATIMIWVPLYFFYISRDMNGILWFSFGLNIACAILFQLTMPECPKWHYSRGEYDKCQEILRYVAKMNGVQLAPSSILYKDLEAIAERDLLQTTRN
jgi:hypothetical protein